MEERRLNPYESADKVDSVGGLVSIASYIVGAVLLFLMWAETESIFMGIIVGGVVVLQGYIVGTLMSFLGSLGRDVSKIRMEICNEKYTFTENTNSKVSSESFFNQLKVYIKKMMELKEFCSEDELIEKFSQEYGQTFVQEFLNINLESILLEEGYKKDRNGVITKK